jgi:DnaK suppressor protein
MHQEQLQIFKQQLQTERQEVRAQLARLRGGDVDRSEASQQHFGQVEDSRAQVATEREVEFAMDEHESAAIRAIDAALNRIESGGYGECVDCGVDIPLARLQASPQSLRCIACQEKHEQSESAA